MLSKRLRINNVTKEKEKDFYKNFIIVPFVRSCDKMIKTLIRKSDCIVEYRCLNRLSTFISHKDRTDLSDNNDVVYKISCKDCDASYVGQTKRKLKTRINEHKSNIKMDSNKHSVISKHIIELDHNFDWNNVKILDIERNYQKRLMSEMIHIKGQTHGINTQEDTELLDDIYIDIIKRFIGSTPTNRPR